MQSAGQSVSPTGRGHDPALLPINPGSQTDGDRLRRRFLVHAETSGFKSPLNGQPRLQDAIGIGAEDIQVVAIRQSDRITSCERRRERSLLKTPSGPHATRAMQDMLVFLLRESHRPIPTRRQTSDARGIGLSAMNRAALNTFNAQGGQPLARNAFHAEVPCELAGGG